MPGSEIRFFYFPLNCLSRNPVYTGVKSNASFRILLGIMKDMQSSIHVVSTITFRYNLHLTEIENQSSVLFILLGESSVV